MAAETPASPKESSSKPKLKCHEPTIAYSLAKKRVFLLDYDGTLTPIVPVPAEAVPSPKLLETLEALVNDPRNNVWIISGRDQNFLNQHFASIKGLGLSAEHGCFMRAPNAEDWENLAANADLSWQDAAQALFQKYVDKLPGSWIEKKAVAITWHYRNVAALAGIFGADDCKSELQEALVNNEGYEIVEGKKCLEVRPRFVNKGVLVNNLIYQYGYPFPEGPDFVICMGDDKTDEDMFKSLLVDFEWSEGGLFTCSVGPEEKETQAQYYLPEPADVVELLASLFEE